MSVRRYRGQRRKERPGCKKLGAGAGGSNLKQRIYRQMEVCVCVIGEMAKCCSRHFLDHTTKLHHHVVNPPTLLPAPLSRRGEPVPWYDT